MPEAGDAWNPAAHPAATKAPQGPRPGGASVGDGYAGLPANGARIVNACGVGAVRRGTRYPRPKAR